MCDPTLDEVNVVPSKLAGLVVISNELANDSSPAALQVVGDGLVRDLAAARSMRRTSATPPPTDPTAWGSLTVSTAPNGGAWATLDAFEAANMG